MSAGNGLLQVMTMESDFENASRSKLADFATGLVVLAAGAAGAFVAVCFLMNSW